MGGSVKFIKLGHSLRYSGHGLKISSTMSKNQGRLGKNRDRQSKSAFIVSRYSSGRAVLCTQRKLSCYTLSFIHFLNLFHNKFLETVLQQEIR